jgi:hypothetical protein
MFSKIREMFSSYSVYQKTNRFYQQFIASIFFSVLGIPWFLLNFSLIFGILTYVCYIIGTLSLLPNIHAFIDLIVTDDDEKGSFRQYCHRYYLYFKKDLKLNILFLAIVTALLIELNICLTHQKLQFIVPIFFLALVVVIATLLRIYLSTLDENKVSRKQIRFLLLFSIRYLSQSFIFTLIILLWLSIGYYVPVMNVMLGNLLTFTWIANRHTKLTKKIMKVVNE